MYYGPSSTQLSPTSPYSEGRDRDQFVRRLPPRERYRQRSLSPRSQRLMDMYYPRRSVEDRRYNERNLRGDYCRRDASSVRSPLLNAHGNRSFLMNEHDNRYDQRHFRGSRDSRSRYSPLDFDTEWDVQRREYSPPPRRSPPSQYNPTYSSPSWDPRDLEYHPIWAAREPRSPSPLPPPRAHSYERLRLEDMPLPTRPRRRVSPVSEKEEQEQEQEREEEEEQEEQGEQEEQEEEHEEQEEDFAWIDDRTLTPKSPPVSHPDSSSSTNSPTDDETLLLRHPPLFPLSDPDDKAMRDDLVLEKCRLSDPQKCYHLYTAVEDWACPDIDTVEAPRLMGTYFVPEMALCDAHLWIREKHKLLGIEPVGFDGGYGFDREYEDWYEGRVCALYTKEEDVKKVGLRSKAWTTEEMLR